MSHKFTKKVHRGEVAKAINAIEKEKQDIEKAEQIEAEKWKVGAKTITGHDMREQKAEDKKKHKEYLKQLYEQETNLQ